MEPEGARTVYILRRMKRESIGHWPWNVYDPVKARPEELRFDLLDEREKAIGEITYGKASILKGVDLTTPWGPAKIVWPKLNVKISIGDKELVRFDMSWLGGKTDLIFHENVVMQFKRIKGRRNDVEFSDGNGSVSFTEEEGTLPPGHPELRIQMTKEEIKRLPKADRPRSIETRDYVQYRIVISGIIPVKNEDIVASLAIFAGFSRVMDEAPGSGF